MKSHSDGSAECRRAGRRRLWMWADRSGRIRTGSAAVAGICLFAIKNRVFQDDSFGSVKESVGNGCQRKLGEVEFIHGRIKRLVLLLLPEGA